MLVIFLTTDAAPALRHIKPRSNTLAIDKITISLLVPDLPASSARRTLA
jgi:hypothetical protein